MRYKTTIKGISPIIHNNGAAGLDTRSTAKREIAEISRKRGSNRTESDEIRIRELECQNSLWLDPSRAPGIPPAAIRSCIEGAARKLKQGTQVREGLLITDVSFEYDRKLYGSTPEQLGKSAQFIVPVVVSRARILRTRAKFDQWTAMFIADVDDELVDAEQLKTWLTIGGQRIGLGDWRPQHSGEYGRFEVSSIKPE